MKISHKHMLCEDIDTPPARGQWNRRYKNGEHHLKYNCKPKFLRRIKTLPKKPIFGGNVLSLI